MNKINKIHLISLIEIWLLSKFVNVLKLNLKKYIFDYFKIIYLNIIYNKTVKYTMFNLLLIIKQFISVLI